MESHPLGVEKTETAVTAAKFAYGNASPILLFVAGAVTGACSFVLVVIHALRLLKPNAASQLYAGKCFSNAVAEGFVHSVEPGVRSVALCGKGQDNIARFLGELTEFVVGYEAAGMNDGKLH